MSKILKLLKKAEELNRAPVTAGINGGGSIPARYAANDETWDWERPENGQIPRRRSIRNLLTALITIVSITIPVSLLMTYSAITEMKTTMAVSEQLTADNRVYKNKIGELENAVKSMGEKTELQNQTMKRGLSALRNQFQEYRKEADELSINQGVLKITVDDLKATVDDLGSTVDEIQSTDKLFSDKIISLSNSINGLKESQ